MNEVKPFTPHKKFCSLSLEKGREILAQPKRSKGKRNILILPKLLHNFRTKNEKGHETPE